jgi:hypothetical protein
VAGNAQNVLQSRDILAYIAAYSSANAMPADSAYGTAPGGTYRDIGYTDGGLGFNVGMQFTDVPVDQSIDPVAVIATGRDVHLTAQMAEFTAQNLKDATSQGSLTTVAAASGVRGHQSFTLDNTVGVNYLTVLFDVKMALGDQESIRFAGWRGQVRSAVQATMSSAAKVVLPLDVQLFPDPNNSNRVLEIRDILAALP